MSNEYNTMNPYATPGQPQPAEVGPAGKNEGKVTAISVIALILGILGILSALMAFGGLAFQSAMQAQWKNPQFANDPGVKMQLEIQAAQGKYVGGVIVSIVLHLVIAIALTIGGAISLGKKAGGFRFLANACGAAAVFEFLRCIFMSFMQIDSAAAMSTAMQNMMKAEMEKSGGNAAPGMEIMGTAMYAGVGIGICFTVVFVLVKVGFYVWGMNVLKQEAARLDGV